MPRSSDGDPNPISKHHQGKLRELGRLQAQSRMTDSDRSRAAKAVSANKRKAMVPRRLR